MEMGWTGRTCEGIISKQNENVAKTASVCVFAYASPLSL